MKGKLNFTKKEIEEIERLLAEKVRAAPSKQKGIRANIRKIGFYCSDFGRKEGGFTDEDFEILIRSEKIKEVAPSAS